MPVLLTLTPRTASPETLSPAATLGQGLHPRVGLHPAAGLFPAATAVSPLASATSLPLALTAEPSVPVSLQAAAQTALTLTPR